MKRTFTVLTMLAVLLLSVQTAWAAETEFSIKAPSGSIKAGESFTVTVDLSGNPGFYSLQFTLVFDQDALSCTKASLGSAGRGAMSASNPQAETGAIVAAASSDPIQGDGTVGTFQFTAQKDLEDPGFRLEDVILTDVEGKNFPFTVRQQNDGGSSGEPQKPADSQQTPGNSQQKPETPDDSQQKPETPDDSQQKPETPDDSQQKPETPGDSQQKPGSTPDQPSGTGQTSQQTPENPAETEPGSTPDTPAPSFNDIEGHWAAEQIRNAAAKGLLSGYSDGSFRPNGQVTRGQIAVILWRMAGRPQPENAAPFTDIAGLSEEFRTAISWGYSKGLLNGTTATTYAPGDGLSRQAAMKLIHGYFGGKSGMEAMLTGTYDAAFTDSDQLSAWAKAPVYWAVYNGILTGTTQTTISPRSGVTRAQLSVFMMRCLDRFET